MNNDEKLIELVKTRRAIYDKTDIFYSNKDYVKELWQEISKEMNQTVPVCQKRWRYLRDYFVRQLHMTQNQQNIEQQRKLQNDTTSSLSLHSMITSLSDTSVISNANNNNNSSIRNNNNVSTTIPMVTQKKKTFWAFYDKMLFLKPFSSTRKSRPKNSNSRRQSQGYINKKSMLSLQSLSNDNNDHNNDTVHTLSDSNSIDDEFDSFDYMTMYQMQFGTEADKAELQMNGASYHSHCISTDDHIQQQTIGNNQQIAQIASISNNNNNDISNNSNEQGSVIPALITQDTDIERIQKRQEKQSQQKLQQQQQLEFRKSISNSSFTINAESTAQSNNEFTAVGVNANNASPLPSLSSLSSKKIKQIQQQHSRENLLNLSTTAALSSPSSSSSSPSTHFESQRKQKPQQNRRHKQQHQQKPPSKKRKRSEVYEEILKILKRSSDIDNDLERNDEHAMFFKSLLNSVRKIDEEHISAFRTEILQIIMKYRYMSQQSDKSSSSSDVVVVDTGEMYWRHKLPF